MMMTVFVRKNSAARKLTLDQVREIRRCYGEGATQGALARHFGVSIGQIGRIVRGESWPEGAGARMPTQAEADQILVRLLQVQARTELLREEPALAESFGPPRREPPPSVLDGGDAPDEAQGAGLSAIAERAAAYEAARDPAKDLERTLKGEGK